MDPSEKEIVKRAIENIYKFTHCDIANDVDSDQRFTEMATLYRELAVSKTKFLKQLKEFAEALGVEINLH